MNFRRIIMVVGSHLRKSACTTVAAHLRKRALAAPASASETSVTAPSAVAGVKADLLATSDGTSASDEKAKAKVAAREQRKKRKMLEKLRNLKVLGGTVKGTLNAFMKSEEEEKVSMTQADLVHWAKRLDKEGKHKHACEL